MLSAHRVMCCVESNELQATMHGGVHDDLLACYNMDCPTCLVISYNVTPTLPCVLASIYTDVASI